MTRTVVVTRTLNAPVEDVYASIADSDRLATLPGVKVQILREGGESRDGVGMQRRVALPGAFLIEEIVGLEPPVRFDYLIRDATVKFGHEYGRITFTPDGQRTRVVWTSRFRAPAGPFTRVAEAAVAAGSAVAFNSALILIERTIRSTARKART
ncbi:SRPBCC family protein [Janibacter hoylei]|uniref:SRPBCC family protein n=1 Tax=Janibacter hoylei TaxID=364298 RepID=UPI0021A4212C|nr:SRPBCC family protein [Janibacter hoylei]MCT1618949.1 SRPBCC family protein [Janibacter hoylei]MCT2291772.1 SRPBCC family protein [Janibacter hoylei]